jgi:hypothetical protein
LKQPQSRKLSDDEKQKVESILVKIEHFAGMFFVEIAFWVKTSPKNAQNMLQFLRFYMGDDFVPEKDEPLFKKGFVLVKCDFRIYWYNKDWLKRLQIVSEKNPRVVGVFVESLEKLRRDGPVVWFMAEWAIGEIKKMEAKNG